jgi:hypothetical protein
VSDCTCIYKLLESDDRVRETNESNNQQVLTKNDEAKVQSESEKEKSSERGHTESYYTS